MTRGGGQGGRVGEGWALGPSLSTQDTGTTPLTLGNVWHGRGVHLGAGEFGTSQLLRI